MKKTGFSFWFLCFGLAGLTAFSAFAGDTLVGEFKGDLKVNNLGAVSYTIPLSVSPGTAGIEPKLSVNYSSRGGNGPLGIGFSLSGLSMISRGAASIDKDGFADPVDFDDNDRFMLSGQRLEIVGLNGSPTTNKAYYGDAGSEYRTEIDSFSRVIANDQAGNGPAWFKVWTKSGQIHEYGNTSNSVVKSGTYAEVEQWAVNRTSDTVGNYMTFTYTDPAVTGRPLISQIDYTGNTNVAPELNPYNSVEFVYEDRPDTLYRASRGVQKNETKRLKTIIMKHDSEHLHEYRLVYTTNEVGQSLLKSIQQFFGPELDADHLPAIEFSYSGTAEVSQHFSLPTDLTGLQSMEVVANHPAVTGNFNGDGKTDVLYMGPTAAAHRIALSNGDGTFDMRSGSSSIFSSSIPTFDPAYSRLQTGDFNGDGLTDICQVMGASTFRWVALCNGDGTFSVTLGTSFLTQTVTQDKNDAVFVMDVDGDGCDDIVGFESYNSSRWVARSNRDGSFTLSTDDAVIPQVSYFAPDDVMLVGDFDGNGFNDVMGLGYNTGHSWVGRSNGDGTFIKTEISFSSLYNPDSRVGTGDFNGDGLTDFYQINNTDGQGHTIGLSNGDGTFDFSKSSDLSVDGNDADQIIRTGDFNGDGLTDIFRLESGASWVALCDGDGTFSITEGESFLPATTAPISSTAGGTRPLVRDFNGDGKDDILCAVGGDVIWLAISEGDGAFTISTDVFPAILTFDAFHDIFSVGDFNGDGMPDLLHLNASSDEQYHWLGLNNHAQSRLEQVVQKIPNVSDTSWPTTQISYLPASDPSVYIKGSGAEYPIRDIIPGLHVVSTVAKTSNSDTSENTEFYYTDYTYRSAREHIQGRGFLGFQQFESYDRQTHLSYVKTLAHDFPFTGETLKSETFYIPDPSAYLHGEGYREPIKKVDNEWLYDLVSGGTLFAYTSKSVETKWELGQPDTPISVVSAWNWFDNQDQSVLPSATQPTTLNSEITYGNLVKTVMDYGGGRIKTTVNTYDDWVDPTHWLLGRLDTVMVIHEAAGQTPIVRSSAFDYDATTGLLAIEIIESGDSVFELRTDYYYDAFGSIERKQLSGAGLVPQDVQNVDYDPRGRFVIASRNAMGHETTLDFTTDTGSIYQALAIPHSSTDPNGLTTEWNYDALGRKVYEQLPDGTETTHTYSWDNGIAHASYKLTTQADGTAPVTTWFDKLGREIRSEILLISGAFYKDTEYNDIGLISRISKPYSAAPVYYTVMGYDEIKRARFVTAPDGTVTETVYNGLTTQTIVDSDERQTGTPAAKNQITTTVKNNKGEVISVTDNKNKTITYTYDPVGNLVQTTDPENNIIEMSYDIRGNKIWMDDPDMGEWSYTYNTLNQMTSQTDANGNVIESEYDLLGRSKKRTNWLKTGGTLKKEGTAEWFYDGTGEGAKLGTLRREEYRDGEGVFINRKTYAYDAYSRLMIELRNYDEKWFYTTLEYDDYSRIESFGRFWRPVGLEDPASQLSPTWHSFVTTNTYDLNGLITEVRDDSNHVWWECNTEDYNEAGKLTRFEQGNGLVTTRDYDPLTGWMTGIDMKDSALLNLSGYGFVYDRIGNLTQRTQTRGTTLTEDCTYDELNRLLSATVVGETPVTATYDDLGNIQTRSDVTGTYSTYQYLSGKPHAVSAAGDCTYIYDANGNVVRRKRGDDYEFTAIWNSFNKPVSLFAGLEGSEFEYDVNGARTKQIIFEDDGAGSIRVRKKIYVAEIYEIEELLSNPTETDRSLWVWVPVHSRIYVDSPAGRIGIYQELASSDGTGTVTRSYLHHDHLGSVVAVSDDAAIPNISYYSFDAWGNRRNPDSWAPYAPGAMPSAPLATDRGYTGHEQLDHLKLVHMNGRIYDPVIGRMITADPTIPAPLNLQSFNRYSYVYNNPLSLIDPTGFAPEKYTAENIGKRNISINDNRTCESIESIPIASVDKVSVNSSDGGEPVLEPQFDEYNNLTGFIELETGIIHGLDEMSKREVEQALADWGERLRKQREEEDNTDDGPGEGYTNYTGYPEYENPNSIDGWYPVHIHGDKGGIYIRGSNREYYKISTGTLYEMMLKDGYKPGTPILFMSCYGAVNGVGEKLSQLAGVDVIAPTHATRGVDQGAGALTEIYYNSEKFENITWVHFSNWTVTKSFLWKKREKTPSATDMNTIYIWYRRR